MQQNTIYKTIRQYSKGPLSKEDMYKLQEIAKDYGYVKNYVYQRYGGVGSLGKLFPGYTVQNEMTQSGLRTQLGLPSVYFYCAVFEALGDIKTQWTKIKSGIFAAINAHESFSIQEKHYLRFVVKVNGCFDNILNGKKMLIPENMLDAYSRIWDEDGGSDICAEKLNKYVCRQVRKRLHRLHTENTYGFAITQRAYRYGWQGKEHGIFISTKENRKRVFVPLTDENEYKKQLYIQLKTEEGAIQIAVPIEQRIRRHKEYRNEIGISLGIEHMATVDNGNIYGECFGRFHYEMVEYLRASNQTYRREGSNNPGRKKYEQHKEKLDARMETYVNQELNRLIAEERPKIIYLPKLPSGGVQGYNKKINYSVTVWKRGFVRDRIKQKCLENSIELVEILGKDISKECSKCGAQGNYQGERFLCNDCGYKEDKKVNAAKNAKKRGIICQKAKGERVSALI
ncbi:hypothetical protein D3Z45_18520 [Lachnospiraceae bacterium]|nr:hypothetical protein [Lachnospiraceae bacterium]